MKNLLSFMDNLHLDIPADYMRSTPAPNHVLSEGQILKWDKPVFN